MNKSKPTRASQAKKSDTTKVVTQANQQRNKTANTGTVKGKRRNIANPKYYDTDEKTGKKTFNQQRYDADKNAVQTKKGGGRPKKK